MESCTLCKPWTAYEALRLGLITRAVPVLRVDGAFVPNPLVVVDRWIDDRGRIVYGARKEGDALAAGKARLRDGTVDLTALDAVIDELTYSLAMTMPGCLTKTIESLRKHKLAHWDRNRESNRAWLGLNMMNEARAGFRAFNEGGKECREVDFLLLRRRLAEGRAWDDALVEELLADAHRAAEAEKVRR